MSPPKEEGNVIRPANASRRRGSSGSNGSNGSGSSNNTGRTTQGTAKERSGSTGSPSATSAVATLPSYKPPTQRGRAGSTEAPPAEDKARGRSARKDAVPRRASSELPKRSSPRKIRVCKFGGIFAFNKKKEENVSLGMVYYLILSPFSILSPLHSTPHPPPLFYSALQQSHPRLGRHPAMKSCVVYRPPLQSIRTTSTGRRIMSRRTAPWPSSLKPQVKSSAAPNVPSNAWKPPSSASTSPKAWTSSASRSPFTPRSSNLGTAPSQTASQGTLQW